MNFENLSKKIQLENEFSIGQKTSLPIVQSIETNANNKDFPSAKSLWMYGLKKKGKVNFQKKSYFPFSTLSFQFLGKETQETQKNEIQHQEKNLYTSYSKLSEIRYVSINLASSQTMKHWAEKTLPNGKILGEVTSANTLHHKSFKPLKGGLFCERIFGPMKDFECACGTRQRPSEEEYQKILEHRQTQRKFCPICDVEYTWSIIRRYQMGYIQLASPVTHIWYLKANPSYFSILLDIKRSHLENIVYCSQTLTLENGLKASQVFLPLSPLNLLKSWQKILSGTSVPMNFDSKKQTELQKWKVQHFFSEIQEIKEGTSQQKRPSFFKKKKSVQKFIYFQRMFNSFSRSNQKLEQKEKNGFVFSSSSFPRSFSSVSSISSLKPQGKIFAKKNSSLNVQKKIEGFSQNFYKNAFKLSQFRNDQIFQKIFEKVQKYSVEFLFKNVEPSFFLQSEIKCRSVKEERLLRVLLFCLQKQIFEKFLQEKTQKNLQDQDSSKTEIFDSIQKKWMSESNIFDLFRSLEPYSENMWTKKQEEKKTILDFSALGTPPIQSTPVNGKSADSIGRADEFTLPNISFSLGVTESLNYLDVLLKSKSMQSLSSVQGKNIPFPFDSGNKKQEEFLNQPQNLIQNFEKENEKKFTKKPLLNHILSIYFTKWSLQKQISTKFCSFYLLESQMFKVESLKDILYFKKQKNFKKSIKSLTLSSHSETQKFSFSSTPNIDAISKSSSHFENSPLQLLTVKLGQVERNRSQIPKLTKMEQNLYFSKKVFQKKIRKNRNKWKSGSLSFVSFAMLQGIGQTLLKQKNQILDYLFPYNSSLTGRKHKPLQSIDFQSRNLSKMKFAKKLPFSFPQIVLPGTSSIEQRNLSVTDSSPSERETQSLKDLESLKRTQKRHNKRELKIKILAQQMNKQDQFFNSSRFIRSFNRNSSLSRSGQNDFVNSTKHENRKVSQRFEKFKAFLDEQKRKKTIEILQPWKTNAPEPGNGKSSSEISGKDKKPKKRQQKNAKKAQHSSDFLRNNIYCLSHRFRWGNDQYWQYFSYYNLAPRDFEDSIIPVYQNRLNLSLFPSFSSSYESKKEKSASKFLASSSVPFGTTKNFHQRKEKTTSLTGAGILQKLLAEFEPQILGDTSELKKLDKQNRIFLNEFNRKIHLLKTLTKRGFAEKSEKKQLKELCQKRDQLVARTKLVRTFFRKKTNPSSMILTTLPVLPPDLRPILKIQNQIAASDLNRLYQRVIYRNDRLKKFKKDLSLSYSFEIKYAQKLLQEAVDNLIQNGKGGTTPERDARGRPLKSLSEILKGKGGRFRQYLLGKRVDYSARSVIVVGPTLKLHECGLPREIALELFLPFLIQRIIHYKFSRTVIGAKTFMRTNKNFTNSILSEIMQSYPILLNRAPTLHRLGFQAFQPKLVEGRAILLHPLVCPAFNADFDGDQMAVHIPLTVEARAEAWKLMFARNHLISSATGEPIILPSQDMVLGCYYLTTEIPPSFPYSVNKAPQSHVGNIPSNVPRISTTQQFFEEEKIRNISHFTNFFNSTEQVLKLYQLQILKTHENIWVKWKKPVNTFNKFLNSQMVSPREIRILKNGNWQEIRPKYIRWFNVDYLLINQYICTTPGRILFYQMTQKCISN